MRKRTRFKSPVRDTFVVLFCLSVAAYFGYTFWKDLNSTAGRSDKEKVAEITYKDRITQRKFDDRVVWERVDKSTPLYNGDFVRTSDLAEAQFSFVDGTTLSLYENTMIQINYSESEGLKISLDGGSVSLNASDKGNVKLSLDDGSEVTVGKGAALSAKSGNGDVRTVDIKNGSASIEGRNGETTSLIAGESVSVSNNGEIRKKSITVTSIPQELRLLNSDGGEMPVKLEWTKSEEAADEDVIIQTSNKKDFSVISKEYVVKDLSEFLLNLPEGTAYWRVYTEKHSDEAEKGKIAVIDAEPVPLLSPVNDAVFRYRNRNPQINFSWQERNHADHYLVKVSSSPDMENPIIEEKVYKTALQSDSLGQGKWWWQVTPYYEINSAGYTGESSVASFSIVKGGSLKAPKLAVPFKDTTISYKDNLNINFIWSSDSTDANYEVILSDTEDFSNILYRKNTTYKNIHAKLPAPETTKDYYWKVIRTTNEDEDFEPESEVWKFTATEYVPGDTRLIYPPEEYSTETSKIASTQFVWKLADEVKNNKSVLQIAKNNDFNSIEVEKEVQGNTLDNISLSDGNWWWRIGTTDSNGNTDYTEARHFEVLKTLTAPSLVTVAENQEIIATQSGIVKLGWRPVAGADFYNIRVYDSDNNLVAENPEALGTSASFVLPDDSYSLRIQAVASQTDNSNLRTGPVQTVDFTVRAAEAITQIQPVDAVKIDGLSALRNPVNFSWRNGTDKPVTTEFVLKKQQYDGTFKEVERIKVVKTTQAIPRLSSGVYKWQIIASSKEGFSLNSKERSFTIGPVLELETPRLISPEYNFVMNSEYLRKNRNITFEWNDVPDSTEYNFVLYKRETNGRMNLIYSEKGLRSNRLRYRKLSNLDVGKFIWNVTAYSYAKDGFEERRSPVATGEFNIEFAAPKEIKAENPGRMYSEE